MTYDYIFEQDGRPFIFALSWRDIRAPKAGGAELFTHKMLAGSSREFKIVHFSPCFERKAACLPEEIDNVTYLRKGNIFTVILHAARYYWKHRKQIDFVIDQCNTHRFFTKFWVSRRKRIFLIFQLTREIWDYHLPFPFSKIGRVFETAMLRLNRQDITITESQSTADELIGLGFSPDKISIIPIGLDMPAWSRERWEEKMAEPTFVYIGRFAQYKGIDAALVAFADIKKKFPTAKLWIIGKQDKKYKSEVLDPLCKNHSLSYGETEDFDVEYKGFVDEAIKYTLLSQAHALLFPSIREGWGIIVTEAAAVGTPSITYDSPGCRDAVDKGNAGYLCTQNTPKGLADCMCSVILDHDCYLQMQQAAHNFAKQFSWEATTKQFKNLIFTLYAGGAG